MSFVMLGLRFKLLVTLFFGFVVGSYLLTSFYPDILWFRSFSYEQLWWTIFNAKIALFALFFILSFVWLFLNYKFAWSQSEKANLSSDMAFNTPFPFLNQFLSQLRLNRLNRNQPSLPQTFYRFTLIIGIVLVSVMMGLVGRSWWQDFLTYFNQVEFGVTEPLFNLDISFYLFTLPFFQHVQGWLMSLCVITLLAIGWLYFSKNILLVIFSKNNTAPFIRRHVVLLLALFAGLMAWGIHLDIYELVYSDRGVVFGAGYTDETIVVGVSRLLVWLLGIESLLLVVWAFRPRFYAPIYGLVVLLLVLVGGQRVLPSVVQNYIVGPNEFVKESEYISRNIEYTRLAYGLDKIQEKQFPVSYDLTAEDIANNDTTVKNIRLWNQEPLKQTFSQLQEIRLYYEFANIDVDRYTIEGQLQQVMLSPRELDVTQLTSQAQTWINQHLVYTHGYGLCMSPVNEVTKEGLPKFYLKDLPTKSEVPDIKVTRPEIYFGERTIEYVLVNTSQKEFNYPKGDSNVYARYEGKGGIQLDSFFKRMVFSLKFSDLKLLISPMITSESRMIYDRRIQEITRKLMPFVAYDQDPYLVVTDSGRMVWMQDGYTLSDKFPYSEPYGRFNYIRNTVKTTIDAYSGEVNFYIVDQSDPIIRVYSKMFPGVFKSIDDMPADMKRHMRYPKDLFTVQSKMYNTYHMADPQVFYNREDLWEIPNETYGETEQVMKPYYMVTKLPGDDKESFVLMLPFTPTNKNNMIAWMNVKCDPDEYGQLEVFKFPKERTIYGPMQIESRIDQDTEISQKLTLWGQVGSRVIRGNIMVVPIEDSLIYVEPIYLQATQSKFPELKRVILSHSDTVVMANTLDEAIESQFSGYEGQQTRQDKAIIKAATRTTSPIINDLRRTFNDFKKKLKTLDWKSVGESLESLDTLFSELDKNPESKKSN